jgi:hypothetical protein
MARGNSVWLAIMAESSSWQHQASSLIADPAAFVNAERTGSAQARENSLQSGAYYGKPKMLAGRLGTKGCRR